MEYIAFSYKVQLFIKNIGKYLWCQVYNMYMLKT